VEDASAFTLFGSVVTGERVGVDEGRAESCALPAAEGGARRVSLPLL